ATVWFRKRSGEDGGPRVEGRGWLIDTRSAVAAVTWFGGESFGQRNSNPILASNLRVETSEGSCAAVRLPGRVGPSNLAVGEVSTSSSKRGAIWHLTSCDLALSGSLPSTP